MSAARAAACERSTPTRSAASAASRTPAVSSSVTGTPSRLMPAFKPDLSRYTIMSCYRTAAGQSSMRLRAGHSKHIARMDHVARMQWGTGQYEVARDMHIRSRMTSAASLHSASPASTMSRVVPATSVTMARCEPLQALSRLDLPTFGLPTSATCRPDRRSCPALCVPRAADTYRERTHKSVRLCRVGCYKTQCKQGLARRVCMSSCTQTQPALARACSVLRSGYTLSV